MNKRADRKGREENKGWGRGEEEKDQEGKGEERKGKRRGQKIKQKKTTRSSHVLSWDPKICGVYAEGARRQVTCPLSLGGTSDTYLTHTVEGTGEAVIGNGCVPGFNRPQGLTVRG